MKTTSSKSMKSALTPAKFGVPLPIHSKDDRKAAIVAALKAKSDCRKVTCVEEIAPGEFRGSCMNENPGAKGGFYTVTIPELSETRHDAPQENVQAALAQLLGASKANLVAELTAKEAKANAKAARLAKTHPNTSELQDAKFDAVKATVAAKTAGKKLTAWQRVQAAAMSTPEKKESAKLVNALLDAGMSKSEIADALKCDSAIVYQHSKGYMASQLEGLRKIKPVVNRLDAPKRTTTVATAKVAKSEAKAERSNAARELAAEEAALKAHTPKAGRKMQIIAVPESGPTTAQVQGAVATLAARARSDNGEKVTIGSLTVPSSRSASAKLAKVLGVSQADLEAAGQLTFLW